MMSSKVRTFIDGGVLITAARGGDLRAVRAGMIINDPNREYVSSVFVQRASRLCSLPLLFRRFIIDTCRCVSVSIVFREVFTTWLMLHQIQVRQCVAAIAAR